METNDNGRELVLGRHYKIISKIGKGKFGTVFKGVNVKTNDIIAIKTENKNTPYKLLKNETTILKYLYDQGSRSIPIVYWFGLHLDSTCLVFTYYSLSLHDYIQKISNWDFDKKLSKINEIMSISLEIIQSLHSNLVLHRDIKSQNFMFKDDELFIIDFGLATFFVDENGEHVTDIKNHDSILGTPLYSSYNIHCGHSHSRRDDLISLGYTYLFMLYGELPWSMKNIENNTISDLEENHINHHYNIIRKEKKSYPILENLLTEQKIKKYLEYCYNLDYKSSPQYSALQKLFL